MGLLRSQVFQNIFRKMEGYEMMQDESPQWSKSKIKTIVDEILHSDYWTIFFLYAWQFYFLKNHIIIHSKNSNFYGFIGFYEKSAFFTNGLEILLYYKKLKNIWFHSVSFFCQGLTFLTFFALKNCSLESTMKWVIFAWVTRVDMELQTNLPRVTIFPQGPGRARGGKWWPVGGWYAIPYQPKSPMQKFHFILSIFPKIVIHDFRPVGQKCFCRLVTKNIADYIHT